MNKKVTEEEIMKENSCRRVAERNLWSTTARREMNWKRPKNFLKKMSRELGQE
jgi:hypothetical protein